MGRYLLQRQLLAGSNVGCDHTEMLSNQLSSKSPLFTALFCAQIQSFIMIKLTDTLSQTQSSFIKKNPLFKHKENKNWQVIWLMIHIASIYSHFISMISVAERKKRTNFWIIGCEWLQWGQKKQMRLQMKCGIKIFLFIMYTSIYTCKYGMNKINNYLVS